jgi:hypothetical protein
MSEHPEILNEVYRHLPEGVELLTSYSTSRHVKFYSGIGKKMFA